MNIEHSKYEKSELIETYVKKIEALREQLSVALDALMNEVKEILPIQGNELAAETDKNIGKYHIYLTKLTQERKKMSSLRGKRDEIEGELNDYYRFNWDKSTKLTEGAIAKYVAAHPVYMAINNLVKDQEAAVLYLDGVVSGVRDRGFAIKNMIEIRKIELGMH